jgi:hypothetical protein
MPRTGVEPAAPKRHRIFLVVTTPLLLLILDVKLVPISATHTNTPQEWLSYERSTNTS